MPTMYARCVPVWHQTSAVSAWGQQRSRTKSASWLVLSCVRSVGTDQPAGVCFDRRRRYQAPLVRGHGEEDVVATAAKKTDGKAAAVKKSGARKQAVAAKPAKKATAPRRPRKPRETCFVMSPFGGWYDSYYSDVYCPAIEAAGLEPCRADDLYRPSAIVQDIWAYVKSARVMLADMTDKNPNVFYELGLAHALDKPVVLLSQTIEDVPFDLRALRVLTYETADPAWADTLRTSITAALKEVLASPTTAVLQPFQRESPESADPSAEEKRDPVVRQLMREVNLLRSEVMQRSRFEASPRDIGPNEARSLIRRFVRQGLPLGMIIDRIAPMGPPPGWIEEEVRRAERSLRRSSAIPADDDSA